MGIDTPERGECGFEESSTAMGAVVGGQEVTLGVEAPDERDRYGRLIAYVDTLDGTDAGLVLIEDGMGVARYDSRDGYGEHAREAAYVAADAASPVAYSCEDAAPAPAEPEGAPEPPAPGPAPGADDGPFANCDAVRAAGRAPIRRGGPGFEAKFDLDGDGVGCK
ncbi:thermonuclease family protein [Aquipuribacter sp. MA13-6]|uniref:thermonuclease family protein n=1 Tax=unclassified Aquipuribacter TaxID=2635084 RepID=UPI003EF01C58